MSREPDSEWIQKQLDKLTTHSGPLDELCSVRNSFKPWTVLKLSVLIAAVDVYTTVISSYFDDWYYVDAMAGTGLVKVEGRPEKLAGSPILAASMARKPFSKMYLIERCPDRARALNRRMEYAVHNIDSIQISTEDYEIIQDDANNVLKSMRNRIASERGGRLRGAHLFGFVDNEGADIEWRSIRKLSEVWCDLLVNHQSTSINRTIGRIEKGIASDEETENIKSYFDNEDLSDLSAAGEKGRLEKYQQLLNGVGRDRQSTIKINGSSDYPYNYQMIYAAQATNSGAPWVDFMDNMKPRIESLSGDDVENMLRVMRGEMTSLSLFSNPNGQTGLGEYY